MATTSLSLLQRVKDPLDEEAWNRLVDLYVPFLHAWGKRSGLNETDSCDLVQEVLTVLAKQLPKFEYDANKSFRSWLKTITLNRAKNFHRAAANRPAVGKESAILQQAAIDSTVDLFEQDEYCAYVTKRLLGLVEHEFSESVWQAFCLSMFDDRPASEIAALLDMSVNRVYLAKSRVLQRLREEAAELLD